MSFTTTRRAAAAKRQVKSLMERMGISIDSTFRPAPCVRRQHIDFDFEGVAVVIESDFRTPLYETIAEIVDYDCYQLREIWRNDRLETVVDVGANVGVFTVLAGLRADRVIAFEPVEDTCRQLHENVALNGLSNVDVVQAAVTSADGTICLEMVSNLSVSARVTPMQSPTDGSSITATGVSLPSALSRVRPDSRISLIKVDCEGGEYALVDQIDESLASRIDAMTFEVHGMDRTRNVWSLWGKLERLGFRVVYKPEMFGRRKLHHLLAVRPKN